MKVALAQLDIAWEDRAANHRKATVYAEQARDAGADLLVLPEMFATGFSMNPSLTAEPPDGETPAFLRSLAGNLKIGVLAGFVLAGAGGRGRNVALMVDRDGRDSALYIKTHLFSFAGEDRYHEAGSGPVSFSFEGIRAACYICYDLRFPELFRKTADTCQVVFVIASWPAARQAHWDALLPARAIENQQYVIGVNRVGAGGGLHYAGGSAVYGPSGALLAGAGDKEKLLVVEIEGDHVSTVRRAQPFLKDRRF